MKKALIITTIGGFLPQFLHNDVKALKTKGYEIHYASDFENTVYFFDPESLERDGIHLHSCLIKKSPRRIIRNIRAAVELADLIKREEIDLVHCHNPVGGIVGRLAAVLSGKKVKVIYTAHGFHFFDGAPFYYWLLFYPVERIAARFTDVIITINSEDFRRAKGFKLKKGGKVFHMHSVGIDTGRFFPNKSINPQVRNELNIPDDAFHLVTAAELNKNKNHIVVLKALEILRDEEIYYSICGEGMGRGFLEQYIREHGLADRVHLTGYRYDMERVLQSADVFLFPSIREGFGMAPVEAMSCSVPVIASDNRGTREYMQDRENGIVVKTMQPEDYAAAITAIKQDKELCEFYGENAYTGSRKFSRQEGEILMESVYEYID